ncbi:hypothetical protein BKA64DRAFT_702167 [Cadophora sp. MPI-SDFR-AT-0126]|nr:hypothetical protein BKA64DRAFT_702167 [Leotiomycetes sp. MPI-SDFR-AT-0126]
MQPGNLLHQLPPELRLVLFQPLCANWDGKVPEIIKALRGDRKLYHEALEEFYRSNTFVFHRGNGWSLADMKIAAVKSIRRARIVVEPGIMHQGLFRINHPDTDTPAPAPVFMPCTLSAATNIRHLVLEFKFSTSTENILPFTPFNPVAFSPNYFITPFLSGGLKRVEMVMPRRSLTEDVYVLLLREKKLEFGIKGLNVKMGVVGRLGSVGAGYEERGGEGEEGMDGHGDVEDEDDEFWESNKLLELEGRESWIWEADVGSFLGEEKEETGVTEATTAMAELAINPWVN